MTSLAHMIRDSDGRFAPDQRKKDAAAKAAVHALPTPAPQPMTATSLSAPQERSDGELEAFWANMTAGYRGVIVAENLPALLAHPTGRLTLSLASTLIDEYRLERETVVTVLNAVRTLTDTADGYNALLVIDHLRRTVPGSARTLAVVHEITAIIQGLPVNNGTDRQPVPAIRTEEELAATTAVVEFLLHFASSDPDKDRIRQMSQVPDARGIKGRYPVVTNRLLEALIRERPQDVHEIIRYVGERGMPNRKRPVDDLRHYLEETANTPALSGGWL